MRRSFIVLLAAASLCVRLLGADKLDDGIAPGEQFRPVFVRMTAQLLARGGAYEKFCRANASRPRLKLRSEVLAALKRNSDESFKAIAATVGKLQDGGGLKALQRYWIVNGFACLATGDACAVLAKDSGVAFVYLQSMRVGQHKIRRPGLPQRAVAGYEQVYQRIIDKWTDDSKDPVTTEGFSLPWNVKRIKADQAWARHGATGKAWWLRCSIRACWLRPRSPRRCGGIPVRSSTARTMMPMDMSTISSVGILRAIRGMRWATG